MSCRGEITLSFGSDRRANFRELVEEDGLRARFRQRRRDTARGDRSACKCAWTCLPRCCQYSGHSKLSNAQTAKTDALPESGRRGLLWVTGGKTPSRYIFSELPQVADIAGARSPFGDAPRIADHRVLGPSDSRLSSSPIISVRSSRIDWLCSAKRAWVWTPTAPAVRSI